MKKKKTSKRKSKKKGNKKSTTLDDIYVKGNEKIENGDEDSGEEDNTTDDEVNTNVLQVINKCSIAQDDRKREVLAAKLETIHDRIRLVSNIYCIIII